MATHGHIGEYNSQIEDWRSYTEQLQNYFLANDVKAEAKQRAILLSVSSDHYCPHRIPRMPV